jgi:Tfp pilus assembly protein PilV
MRPHRAGIAARGVSLVEAIVAMAVMAFGMMAIVGLQSTLRLNSDVAKQRSEAVRIAQEAIEDWRAFTSMSIEAGQMAYADIDTLADAAVAGYTTNTAYTLTRSVDPPAIGDNHKSIRVVVSWTDRNGQEQRVELSSIIARVDPALAGTWSLLPTGMRALRPLGRNPAIPVGADDRDAGKKSIFIPPGSGGGALWVFDNLTGVIVGVCNTVVTGQDQVTEADTQNCIDSTTGFGLPLSGYVRFATDLAQPTAADAEVPTSTARNLAVALTLSSTSHPSPTSHACYTNAPTSTPTSRRSVRYYCAILFNENAVPKWSGTSSLKPLAFLSPNTDVVWLLADDADDARASRYRVCRYTPATSDSQPIPNQLHPRNYTDVGILERLTNQNFLVIRAGNDLEDGNGGTAFTCPTDVPADPANGDFVNSNTLPHQPPLPTPL